MSFPVIRPAQRGDLEALIQFAEQSGFGITSLPHNPGILEKKLLDSERSFHEKLEMPTHETYLFCLEWKKAVIGTSAIISRIGTTDPFFAYHILPETLNCPYLNIKRETKLLHFSKARKKPTEIGTLFLAPQFRKERGFGKLLSLCRFLFIASFKERFASTVIAELRGVNKEGYSPFWEAVGRPFYQLEFPQADWMRAEHISCIEELFPKHPIYVELLSKEAQEVIGVPHPDTVPAQKLLFKQGFKVSPYIDIFDGGPHLYAPTEEILATKESHQASLKSLSAQFEAPLALITNGRLDFRATVAPLLLTHHEATLHPEVASLLELKVGDLVRYYFL